MPFQPPGFRTKEQPPPRLQDQPKPIMFRVTTEETTWAQTFPELERLRLQRALYGLDQLKENWKKNNSH